MCMYNKTNIHVYIIIYTSIYMYKYMCSHLCYPMSANTYSK